MAPVLHKELRTSMQTRMRKVALIYNATQGYDLKVVSGVAAYLREGARWNVYLEENSLKDQRLPDLHTWQGNGIIANFDDPRVATAVIRSKLPTVGFGSGYGWYSSKSRIPYFSSNKGEVARLAADHLMERGFRHFAYCGYPRSQTNGWSEERGQAFAEYVKLRGFPCQIYRGRYKSSHEWAAIQRSLSQWLVSLPKPVGLMAADDERARQVLEVCRASGLRVPEHVAVIGVDNNELLCQLSTPLLTSVDQGAMRVGYEAAALLDRMMAGKKPRQRWFRIEPVGVVMRHSTDILTIEDTRVANAMAFIREHACEGIKVREVVAATFMSRKSLETHFKAVMGQSVHTAIRRAQLERARVLIHETDLPVKQVAPRTGFKSVQHMTNVFTKMFGVPPAKYRRMTGTGTPRRRQSMRG
jgi:LacI family transcriptional regulator